MKSMFWGRTLSGWFRNTYRTLIRHPQHRWWVIAGTLLYLLGPLDIAPDMIPVLGWLDDGLVATLLVTELTQMVAAGLKSRQQTSQASTGSPQAASVIDVDAVPIS